ncbi:MAG TPA: c-type cytochrome [Blastocatellia bacterium]|nr:c-type cytochrome [Blastocatellia bacterium]
MKVPTVSKIALLLLLSFVLVLLTVAHGALAGFQENDKLKDPRFVAEGATLFATTCGNAYCHGTGGNGGGAPRLRGKGLEAGYVFKAVSNGLSGTSMPGFKSELSEEQIWKLVAFILSDAKTGAGSTSDRLPETASATPPFNPAESNAPFVGNTQAGKTLFFDSSKPKSCHACHSFNGEGTPIGPDLSAGAAKSPRALFLSIILPRELKSPQYATITVSLRNGEKIVGVKKEEDAESLRVYDTVELPAVLRTVQKTNISKIENSGQSVMPTDYASAYTMKQLLDLVAFLKSSDSKSPVTLKDLLE